MKGIIYKVTNLINNKIYIGQCYRSNEKVTSDFLLRTRKSKHNADKQKSFLLFHNALKKYSNFDFSWEVLLCSTCTNELDYYENFYICFYNSLVDNGGGYNLREGGLSSKYSETKKSKMSDSAKKRWLEQDCTELLRKQQEGRNTEWHRELNSNIAKTYLHTDEVREKAKIKRRVTVSSKEFKEKIKIIRKASWENKSEENRLKILNKLHSKEAREKTSKKKRKAIQLLDAKTLEVLNTFSHSQALADFVGIGVSSVRSVISVKSRAKTFCKGKYTARLV